MGILKVFSLFSDHLIEIMGFGLMVALVFRYYVFKAGQRDQTYFKTFSRGVEKHLESEDKTQAVTNIEAWLSDFLGKVTASLPERNVRSLNSQRSDSGSFRHQEKETFAEFADGKKSLSNAIRQQIDVLKSPFPPNFSELTVRILDQDKQWNTIAGIPVDTLTRTLDILPGLFVIGGIFGTFIGVANGLPKIGAIDINKINESGPILAEFVQSVSFSMHTSIAGILYSVIMTMLNTIYPIQTSRQDVQKNLERCLEFVWHRLHGEKVTIAEAKIIEVLEGIRADLRQEAGTESEDFKIAS